MCGIAGIVGSENRAFAKNAACRMSRVLARRGPDSDGLVAWKQAVLAHRRLAIFDLSEAGRQPMISPDGSIGVVFNGSIYNYLHLRKELITCGYDFTSNTDTEVLVHGYREWGIDKLVTRLRGMFAFALWDDGTRTLYLVRDRLGVKPLVFAELGGMMAFASNVRALRAAGFVNDLDEKTVAFYLNVGVVPDDYCIYRGASKVPPATIIEWKNGRILSREYWASPTPIIASAPSFDDAVERTERLLLEAVEIRLHADVPIGILLSGGIDSALVCWAATKLGHAITAYTVGTPRDVWDETAAARTTARTLKIEHRVLEMLPGVRPDLEDLTAAYAEPFACASALGMLKVSGAVASSVKVLLTGDGGDDVFLGYPRHRHVWMGEKLARITPDSIRQWWRATDGSPFPRVGPLRRMATLFDYVAGSSRILSANVHNLSHQGCAGDRLSDVTVNVQGCGGDLVGQSFITDYLAQEFRTRFVGEYMTKVDGATMHHGLEARSPFLDQSVWEFASSLPFDLRLRHGCLKAILRKIARSRIGVRVASRKKQGFGVPVHRWLVGSWRPLVESYLRESILDQEGWIRSPSAIALLESASTRGEAPPLLWYLFVLELWMRYERNQAQVKAFAEVN
jgi:asparagine synthase (glutamine-hydrolysing)